MNNLYRISQALPSIKELTKAILFNRISVPLQHVKTCYYCKNFGLYDEEEDNFGEFNRRGAYIDHRSNVSNKYRKNSFDEYDDNFGNTENYAQSRRGFEPRRKWQLQDNFERGNFNSPRSYREERYPSFRGQQQHSTFYRHQDSRENRRVDQDMSKLPLEKNFYEEHPDVASRSREEVDQYRKSMNVTVKGSNIPNPIFKFNELCIPDPLLQLINDQGFPNPTPIQAQGWPIVFSGQDMIGISQTGSGKTLVYALPAVVHIMQQPKVDSSSYQHFPQALVLAPTRELAQQIHSVCGKFHHSCGVRSNCVYGGASKVVQHDRMRGTQICIATPGRLIDFLREGAVNLSRCTYLVLDEADRMLDMGFEPQIRQVVEQIRPDRQTLMWSATWPTEVQSLAENFLTDYVQVTIGSEQLTANPNIIQNVYIVDQYAKVERLTSLLQTIKKEKDAKVLVFAQTKRSVDFLTHKLNNIGVFSMAIHGDISQAGRDRVLQNFRNQTSAVLVATDVAARGLDVKDIHHVINYDFPTDIEDYIHRIGRTARGTKSGSAHSFMTFEDANIANQLIGVIQKVGQEPSPELLELARSSSKYRKSKGFGRSRYQQRSYY